MWLDNHTFNKWRKNLICKTEHCQGQLAKTHLLFEYWAVDPGCSYILSFFHNMSVEIIKEEKGKKKDEQSCWFLGHQYPNYRVGKTELIAAEKQKDERWYLKTKLIK